MSKVYFTLERSVRYFAVIIRLLIAVVAASGVTVGGKGCGCCLSPMSLTHVLELAVIPWFHVFLSKYFYQRLFQY